MKHLLSLIQSLAAHIGSRPRVTPQSPWGQQTHFPRAVPSPAHIQKAWCRKHVPLLLMFFYIFASSKERGGVVQHHKEFAVEGTAHMV